MAWGFNIQFSVSGGKDNDAPTVVESESSNERAIIGFMPNETTHPEQLTRKSR